MEKAVGQRVRIVRTNPGSGEETEETAEVLSTVGGVVLRIGDRIEVLRDDGIPARVIFDEVPPNLRANPTLSVLANAPAAVNGDVTLAYLTRGLSWSADYVAVFEEAQGNVSLQGWITLTNNSGTTFANANAQLVAGDINVVGSEAEWWQLFNMRRNNANVLRAGGVEAVGPRAARRLLRLSARGSDDDRQQPDEAGELPVAPSACAPTEGYEQTFYSFASQDEPVSAEVRVRFSNSQASGLGDQLPSGVVRVYARDARGQPQFVGEDRIGHTSAGSDLALKIGDAFDVTIQPTLRQTTRASRRADGLRHVVPRAQRAHDAGHRDDSPGRSLALQRGRSRESIEGPAHGRRQLRVGRAGARERRDGAHVHGSPKLVSARANRARAGGRGVRGAGTRRARRGHGRSRRGRTPSP